MDSQFEPDAHKCRHPSEHSEDGASPSSSLESTELPPTSCSLTEFVKNLAERVAVMESQIASTEIKTAALETGMDNWVVQLKQMIGLERDGYTDKISELHSSIESSSQFFASQMVISQQHFQKLECGLAELQSCITKILESEDGSCWTSNQNGGENVPPVANLSIDESLLDGTHVAGLVRDAKCTKESISLLNTRLHGSPDRVARPRSPSFGVKRHLLPQPSLAMELGEDGSEENRHYISCHDVSGISLLPNITADGLAETPQSSHRASVPSERAPMRVKSPVQELSELHLDLRPINDGTAPFAPRFPQISNHKQEIVVTPRKTHHNRQEIYIGCNMGTMSDSCINAKGPSIFGRILSGGISGKNTDNIPVVALSNANATRDKSPRTPTNEGGIHTPNSSASSRICLHHVDIEKFPLTPQHKSTPSVITH